MNDQIICPHCKKEFPITEALSHQLKEQNEVLLTEEKKKLFLDGKKWLDEERSKIAKEQEQKDKEREEQTRQKVKKELELQFKDKANENEELKKRNLDLIEQLTGLTREMRDIQSKQQLKNLEYEKRLTEEQDKIRLEVKKTADEEYHLKMREKDKKLEDVMKANDDLRRKLEQGSQQTQGEVLELQLEELLRREFPLDEITEVPKGKLGADLIQIVKTRSGEKCGTIIWEFKRTKVWSNEWISKLKNDQREMKAEVAILISEILPPEHKVFGYKDGIWVGNFYSVSGLAAILRKSLLDVSSVKIAAVGKKEKMEIMWDYLTSVEFKQRFEAIIELFSSMQTDVEKEKLWFKKKWEKQQTSIHRVMDNMAGMYGSLESIMGKALPEIASLELESSDDEQELPKKINSSTNVEEAESLF